MDPRPWVRWWWLAAPFEPAEIERQLRWVKEQGFGGVELAWMNPGWLPDHLRRRPRPRWLGEEWTALVAHAKRTADGLGLGCDFTFGSCWPFGGTRVRPPHGAKVFEGPSPQRLYASWEEWPEEERIVDHLDRAALRAYADAMTPAYAPALAGGRSSLLCDSLELDTHEMWHPDLWAAFERRNGYDLRPLRGKLDQLLDVRYDYRAVRAERMLDAFFVAFTEECHRLGATSRVQCHGAPVDLVAAYASIDIPESEMILFAPHFSRLAASGAVLGGRAMVSCEAFTCIYGFPRGQWMDCVRFTKREQVADLKLLADSTFANGVNRILWHGMPFNPLGSGIEFYASVHVGPDGALAPHLRPFNAYLQRVSELLQSGTPHTDLAVYLPLEDHWMMGPLPPELRTPGAGHHWELRHVVPPRHLDGYHPFWITAHFLRDAEYAGGRLRTKHADFRGLYVDVEWLDADALGSLLRLARQGLPLVLARCPRKPGRRASPRYDQMLDELQSLANVTARIEETRLRPLVVGRDIPPFWARREGTSTLLFFAHPAARGLVYPMRFGQSLEATATTVEIEIARRPVTLRFDARQALCVRCEADGRLEWIDVRYDPPVPISEG